MFARGACVNVAAPMVRYSKLAFRELVRHWGADLVYTPMIVADSFVRSQQAQVYEFSTKRSDRPLVVQFAANNAADAEAAAALVAPHADGVDLNCGCPQAWAVRDGCGCALLYQPELLSDMIRRVTQASGLPCSVKVRLHQDLRRSVDLLRTVQAAGARMVTVHGRVLGQSSATPPDLKAMALLREHATVPFVANGDAWSAEDVALIARETGAHGVMAARGLLRNPAMFAGHERTPIPCMVEYTRLALRLGTPWLTLRQHLAFMSEGSERCDRRALLACSSAAGVLDWFEARGVDMKQQTMFR